MNALMGVSRGLDAVNDWVGRTIIWATLAMTLISAANAIVRKAFDMSSNAFLEIQWYLFAAVFLLSAGYTFLKNAHVRIDFVSHRLSKRAQAWVDIIGIVVFLIPLCLIFIDLSWPLFTRAYTSGEMSQNAGGLIRWPVFLMIPVGFALLLIQGISELIKRVAFLRGVINNPLGHEPEKSDEELLAEELAAAAAKKAQGAQP